MNSTPTTIATADLSTATAPKRRWAAWVAGLAVAMAALVTGCSSSAPAAPARGTDEVALNDRLDAIHDRTDAMKERIAAMKAKREKIENTPVPEAKPPKTPKPPKHPPHATPPDDPGPGTIVIDKSCIGQPTGCLQHH